jgi:hypothetical protein
MADITTFTVFAQSMKSVHVRRSDLQKCYASNLEYSWIYGYVLSLSVKSENVKYFDLLKSHSWRLTYTSV